MNILCSQRFAIALNVSIALVLQTILPFSAIAQLGGIKKRVMQATVCGGGAVAGYKIGDKIAELEAKKMSAEGRSIFLSWHKNHPWDQQLGVVPATLMARYTTDSGREATEILGSGSSVSKESRTLRFFLPETINGVPKGPVCLFLQTQGRILPVRSAN